MIAWIGRELRHIGSAVGVLDQVPASYLAERRARLVKARNIDVAHVEARIAERTSARNARNPEAYKRADAIRNELAAEGIELLDTPAGTDWRVCDGD
jgi:cysteinyl-tRNA synthetase